MKNLIRVVAVIVLVITFSQAKAQMSAGVGVVYGTGISNIGFSANGKYALNDTWSVAPSFTYFLKKDYVNWSALDFDANYQLTDLDNIGSLYAIGGLNVTFFKMKYEYEYDFGDYGDWAGEVDASGSDVGLNLGLGLNVPAGDNMTLSPELKYTLGGANYLHLGVSVLFSL